MITEAAPCRFSTIIRWLIAAVSIAPYMVMALDAEQLSTSPSSEIEQQLPATQQVASSAPTERSHRVTDGDTLWNVAKRLRPSYMSIAATMDLLYTTNPEAFLNGDSTKLQKGYLLSFTPPAEQPAAPAEIAESIDSGPVIPRADNLEPLGPLGSQLPAGSQIALDSESVKQAAAVPPEMVELTPKSELNLQAQPQPESEKVQPTETDNPIPVQTSDSFNSQIDGVRKAGQASLNPMPQPPISYSALEPSAESTVVTLTETSTESSAETSDSQQPNLQELNAQELNPVVPSDLVEIQLGGSQALATPPPSPQLKSQHPVPMSKISNNLVESKPRATGDLTKLKTLVDDFRRNPPYTALFAALLALIFIVLWVRRPRQQVASSEEASGRGDSPSQSTPNAADNPQQLPKHSANEIETEATENLVDSVLSGPFAADHVDKSGVFADADKPESSTDKNLANINRPNDEMDLPGQKELEAQMNDELTELSSAQPSADLAASDIDTEHLDYIDPFKVKLDMATLCAEMGDQQTAREILEEIIPEADEAGRALAQAVLEQLDD